ncbi:BNR repeat-like domain-containing protein [Parapedobacter luteus]|uniref:BNR repeat-like domain-containing protein n=1 Tax=Parapedobacter luteus TaxID=623280 RepID=A0A1T5E4W6_9SPHI|nr:exo-alpha-sialidase [Parapedobacter luteus]SKB79058.1 BNR repeat-like domain-containing protein [Parapedobacter luteus]
MKTRAIYLIPAALILFHTCTSQQKKESLATVLSQQEGWAKTVYLTQDFSGLPVLAWTEADGAGSTSTLYFSGWDTVNRRFSERIRVPANPALVAHAEGMPKIVFSTDGAIYAVYAVRIESRHNPYAARIEYLVSRDGGDSWTDSGTVHRDSTQEAGHDFFDAIALQDGRIGVSWLDKSYEKGGRPVHFAVTDHSGRFTHETVVDDFACECCRTALYERDGVIALLYRDIKQTASGTVRDIHYSISEDSGRSFREGSVYSKDEWRVDGCPHNGPDVVTQKDSLFATWFTAGRNKGLFYGELDYATGMIKRQLLDSEGQFAQLALLADGRRIAVYNAHRAADGDARQPVFARTFPDGETLSVSGADDTTDSPVVIGLPDGSAIAAWISRDGAPARVKYKYMDFPAD